MRIHGGRRPVVVAIGLSLTVLLAACGGNVDGAGGHPSGADHGSGAPTAAPSGPSGTAFNGTDVQFATDMIAHHRQALEMALLASTKAVDPQVKELAAKIRAAQDPEITTMSGWLRQWGQPVPSPAPAGAEHSEGMDHGHDAGHAGMPGMLTAQEMHQLATASGATFDRLFLQFMIKHHQGAIEMATTTQRQGGDAQVKQLATKIATDQDAEIKQMQDLLGRLP